jgi:hypothetical protein
MSDMTFFQQCSAGLDASTDLAQIVECISNSQEQVRRCLTGQLYGSLFSNRGGVSHPSLTHDTR